MQYIHLAGTNAKGSTAQYIAEIIGQERSCGLFTSPHIFSPCERMKINGRAISKQEYDVYMQKARGDGKRHLFCVWTDAALAWFADYGVEFAVIETGLGGRLDPTNVIPAEIQVLTPISFDHTDVLGDTLTKIAREKCGIIKPGAIVFSHPQQEEALRVIRQTCRGKNARFVLLDENNIRVKESTINGQRFDFFYEGKQYKDLRIKAVSPMQVENACVAVMAAVEVGVQEKAIRAGLYQTEFFARAQMKENIVIDGAHNPAAIRELSKTVAKYYPNRDITVLTAIMRDKDLKEVAGQIELFADRVICTCAEKKRGFPAKEMLPFFRDATAIESPEYAFEEARRIATQKNGILVVCGSFYLAAHILHYLS